MNRQDKREKLRDAQKREKWYNSLNVTGREYIKEVVEASKELVFQQIIRNIDTATTATLFDMFGLERDEIFRFNEQLGEYLNELIKYSATNGSTFVKKEVGDSVLDYMKEIILNELQDKESKEKVIDILQSRSLKAKVVKKIREKYKEECITTPHILNCFAEVTNNLGIELFLEGEIKDMSKKAKNIEIEEEVMVEGLKKESTGLKVISKIVTLEGKFGIYEIDGSGVKLKDKEGDIFKFTNLDEVRDYERDLLAKVEELREAFKY